MKRRLASGAVLLASFMFASSSIAEPQPSSSAASSAASTALRSDWLERVNDALESLKLEEAQAVLDALDAVDKTAQAKPMVLFARAELAFYRGDYAKAVELANRANESASMRERRSIESMSALMLASRDVTAEYERRVSSDGRYIVLHPKGKDVVIGEQALEVLQAADRSLAETFGVQIPGPIRLEIYPSPETLAQVSPLTVEQIKTTGTIALSKWNRLMITSPKALVRGYPWADTITHELTHMVISRLTGERAPVWLQEGTAKLLERSWRTTGNGLVLDAGSRALLHEHRRKGTLLTFDEMHPSIAMLPSEDQAILAFAEVATFMEAYVKRYGKPALRAGLDAIAAGVDARTALAKAAGSEFHTLENEWRKGISSDAPEAARTLKTRFRVGDGDADESADVTESSARRFLRLGDLLWDRGRAAAAAKEYEKAHRADTLDPIVAARWGRAALAAGNAKSAVEALAPQTSLYPGHAPTHAVLGAAYLALGERARAASELREAVWLNPFDPSPQCGLVEASSDAKEIARAQRACDLLRVE